MTRRLKLLCAACALMGSLAGVAATGSLLVFSKEKTLSAEIEQDQVNATLDDIKRARRLDALSFGLGATADALVVGAALFAWKGVKKSKETPRVSLSPTGTSITFQF